MGKSKNFRALLWHEYKDKCDKFRSRGIRELLYIYNLYKSIENDPFKWGDEVEFSLIKFDHENKKVYQLLKGSELYDKLKDIEHNGGLYTTEYGEFMIEVTPDKPFGSDLNCFKDVENSIKNRRSTIQSFLDKDEYCVSLTNFPRTGCSAFTWPILTPKPESCITKSIFYPEEAISHYYDRAILSSHCAMLRRNMKALIYVPIYKDKNTPSPFIDKTVTDPSFIKEDHIYMDSVAFGSGCSCLQVTFQAKCVNEARHLYDQLIPITPILLALSAAAPIWRGYLSNIDCRFNVISQGCDDRTQEERGNEPLKNNKYRIGKSRNDSVSLYISERGNKYNDLEVVINEEVNDVLLKNNIDEILSRHFAYLFIRDPIVVFEDDITLLEDNTPIESGDLFDSIQSTNWQSMRFKPPPIQLDKEEKDRIGWRVEFRPIDLQLTDFENSAFCAIIILLVGAIKEYKLDFLMPITKVDENMKRAHHVNACLKEKFFFRKNILTEDSEIKEMNIDEIMNGSAEFKGIIPILRDYLKIHLSRNMIETEAVENINKYLNLFETRSNGKTITLASFIRNFVDKHPSYKHDSVITDEINYDLIWKLYNISSGKIDCPELFQK